MDVRCERCRAQYAFDDDQITPAGLTVQCNGCGHVFRVMKKELVVNYPVNPEDLDEAPRSASSAERQPTPPAPPLRAPQPLPAPQDPRHWTIRQVSGQTLSFSELNTLQRWIVERKVAREDEVTQGDGAWVRLGTLAELQSFFEVVEAADRAKGPTTSRYPAAPFSPQPFSPPPPYLPSPPAAPPPPPRTAAVNVELDEADLQAVGKSSRSRNGPLVGLLLLVSGAAVAYVFMPSLFGVAPSPPPRPEPVSVPLTITMKQPEPPPPPPPEPKPEAKPPEPVPEPPVLKAPEPTPDPKPKARAPTAKQLLAEAMRLRERGSTEQALDLYGKVAAQDPENAEALAGRGLCYFDLEQYGPAEASLQEALRLSPRQADALMGLAETYRAQGRKAEAIALFERYLAAHPGGDEAALARNAINQLKE